MGAVALVLTFILALSTPANATAVSDGGFMNCGNLLIGVRSYGHQLVYHGTTSTTRRFYQETWRVRNSIMADTSSFWDVTAFYVLSDPGTYGYCSSAG